jgi:hypothetical protein
MFRQLASHFQASTIDKYPRERCTDAVYRIVVAVFMAMPSLAFADSHPPAIAAREQAALQGMAVRSARGPSKERAHGAVPFEEYSRAGDRYVHKEMNTMAKLLTMFALLTGLTGLFIAPSPAFAQVCNPALAAGFLSQCPPASEGLFDNRGFRHFRGDDGFHDNRGFHDNDGFHDNHGFHGDGGQNNFGRGVGHGDGMGHGGGAGHGR